MIHSAPQRNAATLRKVLAPFSVSHVIAIDSYLGVSLSFFLSLDFIAISDCVFNNKNNYVLGHTGYQIIITTMVISSTPSWYANLRVATRVYDVRVAQFFLKIAHLPFTMGLRGPRAYGLRPQLWLLCLFNAKKGSCVV